MIALLRWASLGAGLLLAAADHGATVKLNESGEARVGGIAPSFGLWGVNGDGPFVLDKLRKLPSPAAMLVTFGASWCGPCKEGLPRLKKFTEQHRELRMVLIDVEADAAEAQAWVKKLGLTCTVLHDKFKVAATRYGAANILPRTFLVDPRGRVRAIYSIEGTDLEAVLAQDLSAALGAGNASAPR